MKSTIPYDVSTEHSARPFLTFETPAGGLSLPWHDLKIIRISPDGTNLVLEYSLHSVKLSGAGLATLCDLACAFRLKALRCGTSTEVRIDSLRIVGEESE